LPKYCSQYTTSTPTQLLGGSFCGREKWLQVTWENIRGIFELIGQAIGCSWLLLLLGQPVEFLKIPVLCRWMPLVLLKTALVVTVGGLF
jgi:hypothetical protein